MATDDVQRRQRDEVQTRLSMMGLCWDEEDENVAQVIWDAYLLGRLDGDEVGFERGYDAGWLNTYRSTGAVGI